MRGLKKKLFFVFSLFLGTYFSGAAAFVPAWARTPQEPASLPLQLEKTDPALEQVLPPHPTLTRLYGEAVFAEGPAQLKDGSVIFSDIPNNRVLRYQKGKGVSVYLKPSQFQNGHALDKKNRLLAASHGKRALERQDQEGKWEILVDLYGEKKLNSPNDLVVDKEGEIWFTDPSFGIDFAREGYGGNKVIGGEYAYRFNPKTGALVKLDTPEVTTPNGIALSPDEKALYLSECERGHDPENKKGKSGLVAYEIDEQKQLHHGRILAEIAEGNADGVKVDKQGNIWVAAGKKVEIFSPEGKKLGMVFLPEAAANLLITEDKDHLEEVYITATKGLYLLRSGKL